MWLQKKVAEKAANVANPHCRRDAAFRAVLLLFCLLEFLCCCFPYRKPSRTHGLLGCCPLLHTVRRFALLPTPYRAASVFSILLLLLRDSSNFKIRIQAAAALAVPETINDYGKSYYGVVKSVEHVVENFKSDHISEPSNFRYWIALEKQLTSTMLHLLSLAARSDNQAIQDFLVKKSSFLEVWIKDLCSSLGDTSKSLEEVKHVVSMDQKWDVILRTIQSLIEAYESSNHQLIAQRILDLYLDVYNQTSGPKFISKRLMGIWRNRSGEEKVS